jgi:pyroglutamyl-peptidase
MRSVLITGFGPFPGVAQNISAALVLRLGTVAPQHFPDDVLNTIVLPTEWETGPALLEEALETFRPNVVIHFGVSDAATGFQIETQAVNRQQDTVDAAGRRPHSECVRPNCPGVLPSTFPGEAIRKSLEEVGLPAVMSSDAGAYLCNAVLYRSLLATTHSGTSLRLSGFIHVPAKLAGGYGTTPEAFQSAQLTLRDLVGGGLIAIRCCLEHSRQRVNE